MAETAKLELDGITYELPVITGTENEKAIDILKLRAETGYVTLDNGFMNTGSCRSAITFLDGEKGILRYRGYPIEQLAEHSRFLEVAYLLAYGELPTQAQFDEYLKQMGNFNTIPSGVQKIIEQFPNNSHPMGVVSSTVNSMCSFYPEYLKMPLEKLDRERAIVQMMAQTKIIAASFYRQTINKKPVPSDPNRGYADDFLHMMFDKEPDEEVVKALDILFTLHADHEQNCSASTVRVIGSSEANIFATISGGINALWGQLHGGANQRVLEMLTKIDEAGGDYKMFINKAKDKSDPFRLMGFGHRVYKNFDPRATIIKKACDTVLEKLDVHDPLLDIAKGLEEEARSDDYFVSRNLYPNVDFYSGIIYKALGIPTNMFTVMFVLGRMPGWLAQWKEMREDSSVKISRPRQIYIGENQREYTPIGNR